MNATVVILLVASLLLLAMFIVFGHGVIGDDWGE